MGKAQEKVALGKCKGISLWILSLSSKKQQMGGWGEWRRKGGGHYRLEVASHVGTHFVGWRLLVESRCMSSENAKCVWCLFRKSQLLKPMVSQVRSTTYEITGCQRRPTGHAHAVCPQPPVQELRAPRKGNSLSCILHGFRNGCFHVVSPWET